MTLTLPDDAHKPAIPDRTVDELEAAAEQLLGPEDYRRLVESIAQMAIDEFVRLCEAPRPAPAEQPGVELQSWDDVERRALHDPAIQRAIQMRDHFGLTWPDVAPTLVLALSEMREKMAEAFAERLKTMPRIVVTDGAVQ